MINTLFGFLFGSRNGRVIKALRNRIAYINDFESSMSKLSNDELKQKTSEFRQRFENGESLDSILNEAFAVVREASVRTLGLRQFDVQLIGGIVLHEGKIAEMKTGEGKTLVAVAPMYLNAITGKGAHLVTVNEYLADRDASNLSQVYNFLDMSVGLITSKISDDQKRKAYQADVTYGTNNEFGFDYLRDNMKFNPEDLVQRGFNYAIVDEVDSILIDEARTPLIISGHGERSSDLYSRIDKVVKKLSATDYEKDEKQKNVMLTEIGVENTERMLKENQIITEGNLFDFRNMSLVHYVSQAVKANYMFKKEVDYIVKNNKVMIIDEFTGRIMDGRRYSDGLHQAIEAKENVTVQMENQTLASITFQNFFRMYSKLSGMTGTAITEAAEFNEIYNLDTIAVPTNVKVQRIDENDEIYRTVTEKHQAILKNIKECYAKKQPVLVGTSSVEKSEELDALLTKEALPHTVLNAKFHEYEAQIIAEAGAPGSITIATNMAGRGTDIKLGGSLETRLKVLETITDENEKEARKLQIQIQFKKDEAQVLASGGLYIIGTERHESRRIDNQLRGRAGRQGDPGHSRFFLSLQDDLMRIFGGGKLDVMLQKLGLQEGEAIVHPWINKAVEKAQSRVEAHNFDIRKHLLKFDDVMNEQRKIIYQQRLFLMQADYDISMEIEDSCSIVVNNILSKYNISRANDTELNATTFKSEIMAKLNLDINFPGENINQGNFASSIISQFTKSFEEKKEKYGESEVEEMAKFTFLRVLDQKWKDHLLDLDRLRQGVNLRAYAQKDPLNEYKVEAFSAFQTMIYNMREEAISVISRLEFNETQNAKLDLLDLTALNLGDLLYIAPDENASGNPIKIEAKKVNTEKRNNNPVKNKKLKKHSKK